MLIKDSNPASPIEMPKKKKKNVTNNQMPIEFAASK